MSKSLNSLCRGGNCARKMMVTNDAYLKGEPIESEIVERVPGAIEEAYKGMDAVITQGFIASNLKGE